MKKYITIIAAGLALAFTGLQAQVTTESIQAYYDARPTHPSEGETQWSEYYAYFQTPEAIAILTYLYENGTDGVDTIAVNHFCIANRKTHPQEVKAVLLELLDNDRISPLGKLILVQTDPAEVVRVVGTGLAHPEYVRAFKEYRATLPKAEQIALTQKEKDSLVAAADRTAAQDKWLTEVSADLMALKLDQ